MDLQISGRTALVTGAARGIGLAAARQLAQEGVRVVLTDIDEEAVARAARDVPGAAGSAAADLTSTADVTRLGREVRSLLGAAPDIVVHAAGTTGATGAFHEIDDDGWHTTMEVDFFSGVRVVREFVTELADRGWGRIILLASEDARNAYVDDIPYVAAKAAVLACVKALSKTYGSSGVLVNAVSPAFVQSDMTDAMMHQRAEADGTSFDEAVERFLDEERPGIELHRRGRVEEVAAVIAFLASEGASFVNGSDYRVDGGSVATI